MLKTQKMRIFYSIFNMFMSKELNLKSFIEEGINTNGVLVHCYGGFSRSPTILIAYLMKKHNIGFGPAFERLKSIKPDLNPNEGFIEKLKLFEKRLNTNVEFSYKCGKCRKTLFTDVNVDFEHFYT